MGDPATCWPADPATAVLVLDFDGTLAPIVEDPAAARMPSDTAAVLSRLTPRLGRVAIVSGRPAAFLQQWAPVPGVQLIGLYGLEHVEDEVVVAHPDVAAHAEQLDGARADLRQAVEAWPGSELEDKGNALAVHWRRSADVAAAGADLTATVADVARRRGLRMEPGKLVLEVRPPVDADKGTAVRQVAEGASTVAFAGDDLGDLPAFAVVRQLGGLSIAVDHGAETADALRLQADLVVSGTDGMLAWLSALADRLD